MDDISNNRLSVEEEVAKIISRRKYKNFKSGLFSLGISIICLIVAIVLHKDGNKTEAVIWMLFAAGAFAGIYLLTHMKPDKQDVQALRNEADRARFATEYEAAERLEREADLIEQSLKPSK
jgi:hypothetical protein